MLSVFQSHRDIHLCPCVSEGNLFHFGELLTELVARAKRRRGKVRRGGKRFFSSRQQMLPPTPSLRSLNWRVRVGTGTALLSLWRLIFQRLQVILPNQVAIKLLWSFFWSSEEYCPTLSRILTYSSPMTVSDSVMRFPFHLCLWSRRVSKSIFSTATTVGRDKFLHFERQFAR